MGGGSQKRRGLITAINVTPLVDIMLVLLIVFMLTADLITSKSIEVELPQASSGAPAAATILPVTLTRDGRLLIDGQPASGDELRQAIREAVARDRATTVVIDGDKLVSHGRIVWVIDVVKTSGVASFAVNVDPAALIPPEPPADGA